MPGGRSTPRHRARAAGIVFLGIGLLVGSLLAALAWQLHFVAEDADSAEEGARGAKVFLARVAHPLYELFVEEVGDDGPPPGRFGAFVSRLLAIGGIFAVALLALGAYLALRPSPHSPEPGG